MSDIKQRKKDHIRIVMEQQIEPLPSSFDKYRLPYKALPEIDIEDIALETRFFDWLISFPFIVSSMTGGEQHGRKINENLAIACNLERVPFGLGSMRVIMRHPEVLNTFDVKSLAPSVPMFANVGLVQLNYGFSQKDFLHIIDSVKADGLFIHINHLQEAVQPEGDTNFKDLLPKLKEVLKHIQVPVVAKEVGHGIDRRSAEMLFEAGITMIDVAGMGGSSWSWIEGYRQPDYSEPENLGYLFRQEGIPTDESLKQCAQVNGLKLIAGGGVRNGLHIAKAIALGADYATSAGPFLKAALDSPEAVSQLIRKFKKELQVAMFSAGVGSIDELKALELLDGKSA